MQLKFISVLTQDSYLISDDVCLKSGGFTWVNKKRGHRNKPVSIFAKEKLH